MRVGLFKAGLLLILIGFALAFTAVLLPLLTATLEAGGNRDISISGGGCILIMFVPICFGVGEAGLPLMVIAATLAVVLATLGLLVLWKIRPKA